MGLTDRLQADVKTAMRDGDAFRRDTLRMALAAAQNAEKDKRAPLTDDEGVAVISREVKRRRESIEAFDKAGRTDLADIERAEAEILVGVPAAAARRGGAASRSSVTRSPRAAPHPHATWAAS